MAAQAFSILYPLSQFKKIDMKKYAMRFFALVIVLTGCKSKPESGAIEAAKQTQSTLDALTPSRVATTSASYTMKAKINGAAWEATAMMPPKASSRIIGYAKDDYISFPYDRRNMVVGKKILLGEDHAGVDVFMLDNLFAAKTGEMEITKVNDHSAEGEFSFTATNRESGKTLEVTEGFFRILF